MLFDGLIFSYWFHLTLQTKCSWKRWQSEGQWARVQYRMTTLSYGTLSVTSRVHGNEKDKLRTCYFLAFAENLSLFVDFFFYLAPPWEAMTIIWGEKEINRKAPRCLSTIQFLTCELLLSEDISCLFPSKLDSGFLEATRCGLAGAAVEFVLFSLPPQ